MSWWGEENVAHYEAAAAATQARQEKADYDHEQMLAVSNRLAQGHREFQEAQAHTDPLNVDMAKVLYEMNAGHEFAGSDEEAVRYAIDEMGRYKYAMFQADLGEVEEMGTVGYATKMLSDDTTDMQRLAFLHWVNADEAMDADNVSETGRAFKAMLKDPTSYAGFGLLANAGYKLIGRKGAGKILQHQIANRLKLTALGLAEGYAFGHAGSAAEQQATIGASDNPYFQQQIDHNLMRDVEIGSVGALFGGVLSNADVIGKKMLGLVDDAVEATTQHGTLGMGVGPIDKTPVDDLPMDEASRMARSEITGHTKDAYHGSTHDIHSMGGATGNPEGHFGAAHYFTTSPDDASRHYAGVGPDLTARIEQRVDQLSSEIDGYEPDDLMAVYSDMTEREAKAISEGDSELFDKVMRRIAKQELAGETEGVIYPVRLRLKNTFDISADGDTFMKFETPEMDPEDYMDEAAEYLYREDYVDEEDYQEALLERAQEIAQEDSWNFEPEGELVDFIQSLRSQAYDYEVDNLDELIGQITDAAMDGGLSGKELDEIMRNSNWWAYNDQGQIINNEMYRQAIEDAGFDSIVHDADIFRGMDVEAGTKHTIVFDPKNVRSRFAKFDPEKAGSASLTAGVTGVAVSKKEDDEDL